MADTAIFLRDVRDHAITIEIDQGAHRSVQFKRPSSFAMNFRLVTWPGHLAISGDMGDFIFARTHDMFEFFRDDSGENRINKSYWAEKLQGTAREASYREFSTERFADQVKDAFDQLYFDDDETKAESWEAITDEWDGLIGAEPSTEAEAYDRATNWQCHLTDQKFSDVWAWRLWDYSYHFVWCLRAIVWGIKQYDLVKEGRTQAEHDKRVLKGWM